MYRKKLQMIFIVSSVFSGSIVFAQDLSGSTKRKADNADQLFSIENYWEALPAYKELADANPTNVKFNNRTGICYFFSSHKTRCIPYFEAAVKNWGKDTIPEVFYYLGTSYQMLNQFDKAIDYFNLLKKQIKPENGTSGINDVDRSIQQCNIGKKFVQDPTSVKIFNLGPTINTNDPEYAPVISSDESKLIFTSKRKEGTGSLTTPDGFYYEDIYIADKVSEGWNVQSLDSSKKDEKRSLLYVFWSKSRQIGSSINTRDHDAAISLSPDGKSLFIYRDNFIYETKFANGKWGTPVKLSDNVNEKRSFQPSCSMTNDGKSLYIVSDRPGGIGGKDIYVSSRQADGNWGPCTNLGDAVNTEYDEDSPFITADGKTLYFSSQGHENMGGYDIFKSELIDGKWSNPVNLGYPTNTGADDIFFVMNANETRAYLSSIKNDTYGDYDIYVMAFVPETHLFAAVKEGNSLTPINTVIRSRGHKAPIDTMSYAVCLTPGRHKLTLLAPDEYSLTVEAPGYKPHAIDVKVPNQNYKKPFYNEVNYETFKAADGKPYKQVTTIYTAFFDVDSVVNADPKLANMSDRQSAYSAMVKSLDQNKTKLNFKVFTFTDIIMDTTKAILASGKDTSKTTTTTGTVTATTTGTKTTTTGITGATGATATTTTTTSSTETAEAKVFEPVLFDFSKSLLRDEVRPELDEILAYLKENKNVKLDIYGHTDAKGADQFNDALSLKRARAAVEYLASKGIDPKRLKAIGKGERQPVAPDENPDKSDNPDGRQKNRRVEFKVVPLVSHKK
jgi:outer membrane protein OmpA-like peptidoglycan-associated protein